MNVSSHSLHVGSAVAEYERVTARPDWGELIRSRAAALRRAQAGVVYEVAPVPQARPWNSSLRVVGVLAFSQSLIFLVIWLFCCFSAGARQPGAAAAKPGGAANEVSLDLEQSTYLPAKSRDPFQPANQQSVATGVGDVKPVIVSGTFQLQGILYSTTNPSAVVNDKLLSLNKPIKITTGSGPMEVKAVTITRDTVVLEVAGQRTELRMTPPKNGHETSPATEAGQENGAP